MHEWDAHSGGKPSWKMSSGGRNMIRERGKDGKVGRRKS
jgi:hypothetical protein